MRHLGLQAIGLFLLLLLSTSSAYAANECAGHPWEPSNGRTCANLGLSGDVCDDTRTHIRFCPKQAKPAQRPLHNNRNQDWVCRIESTDYFAQHKGHHRCRFECVEVTTEFCREQYSGRTRRNTSEKFLGCVNSRRQC